MSAMVQRNITRRDWVAAVALAATPARAQTPAQAALVSEARSEIRQDAEVLKKFPLPTAVEPATVFRP